MESSKDMYAKCRRGSDVMTKGQGCPSITVEKISPDGSHNVTLKCKKCGYIWIVSVGGAFSI